MTKKPMGVAVEVTLERLVTDHFCAEMNYETGTVTLCTRDDRSAIAAVDMEWLDTLADLMTAASERYRSRRAAPQETANPGAAGAPLSTTEANTKEIPTQPETGAERPKSMQQRYRGLLYLECPECGSKFFATCKYPGIRYTCHCGHEIAFRNMRRFESICPRCSEIAYGWTNTNPDSIEFRCRRCEGLVHAFESHEEAVS